MDKIKNQILSQEEDSNQNSNNMSLAMHNQALIAELDKLEREIIAKNEIIRKLEEELGREEGSAVKLMPSKEEVIAEMQISKILDMSLSRTLTLDETRQLEILTKIKRSASDNSPSMEGDFKRIENEDTTKLVALAKRKTK